MGPFEQRNRNLLPLFFLPKSTVRNYLIARTEESKTRNTGKNRNQRGSENIPATRGDERRKKRADTDDDNLAHRRRQLAHRRQHLGKPATRSRE
ncbi:uncharacterized protein G2W53_003895 [Senna tora]|uniref:Uncharacterized protein n=1 Tax=Senna tora TaxID=362788 RepID=A0A834XBW1_9FABA|nr:uncharacterized protein G2W53_003895 [Senna tora]